MNFAALFAIQGTPFLFLEPALPTSSCVSSLQGTHSPWTHRALLRSRLERPIFCAMNSHHVPSCTMICVVDVWSCALGVLWQSVGLGPGWFSPAHSRHRISSTRPPCPGRPSHRSTQRQSHHFWHSTYCHTLVVFHGAHQIAVWRFQFACTCLPRSLLLPSKSWVVAVERDSLPLLSSVCNLIDCINLHGLVLDWRDCT